MDMGYPYQFLIKRYAQKFDCITVLNNGVIQGDRWYGLGGCVYYEKQLNEFLMC